MNNYFLYSIIYPKNLNITTIKTKNQFLIHIKKKKLILNQNKNFFVLLKKNKIIFIFKNKYYFPIFLNLKKKLHDILYIHKKYIKIYGLGYNAQFIDSTLYIKLGFSHKIMLNIDKNIFVTITKKNKKIKLASNNLTKLNKLVYLLKKLKKTNVYKKKGLYLYNESIKLKVGKIRK